MERETIWKNDWKKSWSVIMLHNKFYSGLLRRALSSWLSLIAGTQSVRNPIKWKVGKCLNTSSQSLEPPRLRRQFPNVILNGPTSNTSTNVDAAPSFIISGESQELVSLVWFKLLLHLIFYRTSSFEEGCLAWCNGWAKDTSSFLERKSLVGISMCIQDVDDIYKVVNGSKLDVWWCNFYEKKNSQIIILLYIY